MTKKKWIKPVLIVGGIAVVALFGIPVLMNYLRPGGTINPYQPLARAPKTPMATASLMGIW